MWEKELYLHTNKKHKQEKNTWNILSLLVGQCMNALKAKLFGLYKFQATEDSTNTILFLRSIKKVAFKFESHENIHVSLCNNKNMMFNTFQTHLGVMKYLYKVKAQ